MEKHQEQKALTLESMVGRKINFPYEVELYLIDDKIEIKVWNLPEPQPTEKEIEDYHKNNPKKVLLDFLEKKKSKEEFEEIKTKKLEELEELVKG
jgi:hypothetical protein